MKDEVTTGRLGDGVTGREARHSFSLSHCPTVSQTPLHPVPARGALMRGDLPEEYVAYLLARHVEVHQELLAARRDFHAVEERALVSAPLGEATEVDHHAVAARQLLRALPHDGQLRSPRQAGDR